MVVGAVSFFLKPDHSFLKLMKGHIGRVQIGADQDVFIDAVNAVIEGLFERWSEDEREVKCILLDITGVTNVHMVEALKEFLMKI